MTSEEGAATNFNPSALGLRVIAYDEFSPLIEPGTGCSFQTSRGELVFVATAEPGGSDNAQAVINAGDGPRVLQGEAAGYEGLVEGGEFSGDGDISLTIVREDGAGTPGEIETTSWPATLTLTGKDGAERIYGDGVYSCGS